MNRALCLLIPVCVLFLSASHENAEANYLNMYADLAIAEMERSGIPASIKLGQALLESQAGTSRLALHSNNHFGIKCKSYWKGETYYHKDDDRDRHGRLIESCFRSYPSIRDSYIDHSDFLMNTAHYRELFDLPGMDYKSWARGLYRCGYATDPKYSEKLISIIERYELYRYDLPIFTPEVFEENADYQELNQRYKGYSAGQQRRLAH